MSAPAPTERRSLAWRILLYFDPAELGFVRRMVRFAAVSLLVFAAAVTVALMPLLRSPTGRYMRAVLLLQIQADGSAARVARELVDDYPTANGAYYRILATALRRTGDIEGQVATYEEGAAAMPNDWRSQSDLCWYGAVFGRADEVMSACDRSVELAPDSDSWAFLRRGAARAMTGDTEGAIADLQEGLDRWRGTRGRRDRLRQPWSRWLDELLAGGQPFDEETLERERQRF